MATQSKLYCTMKDHWLVENKFWQSESIMNVNGYMNICTDCANELFDKVYIKIKNLDNTFIVDSNSVIFDEITDIVLKETCRYIDVCFNYDAYISAQSHINTIKNSGKKVCKIFGIYKSKLSTVVKSNIGIGMTYEFSDEVKIKETKHEVIVAAGGDLQNRNDVVRLLLYDPFEFEKEEDKKYLYNSLIDFLDESTLEDSFKLPVCIEIAKGFNQLNHVNNLISNIDYSSADAVGKIKTLIAAKDTMTKTLLAMAKDNGISVNHNNNKSKGAGTLSGIIKQLQEKLISEAQVNTFDILTCEGMRQVADISNKSIFQQLQLDENDYNEMVIEQRRMIEEFVKKTSILEEENRKLKVSLNGGQDCSVLIDTAIYTIEDEELEEGED